MKTKQTKIHKEKVTTKHKILERGAQIVSTFQFHVKFRLVSLTRAQKLLSNKFLIAILTLPLSFLCQSLL